MTPDPRKKYFLDYLRDEAEWGLANSHRTSPAHGNNCNARRQLRLIIAAINQFKGIADGNPIGWAQPTKAVRFEEPI